MSDGVDSAEGSAPNSPVAREQKEKKRKREAQKKDAPMQRGKSRQWEAFGDPNKRFTYEETTAVSLSFLPPHSQTFI